MKGNKPMDAAIVKCDTEGNFVEGNLHEWNGLSSYYGHENLSSGDTSSSAIGELKEMNEVAKYNRLFRCDLSDIVGSAFVFHSGDVVSGSWNIFGKRNTSFIRHQEINRMRRLNNRRRRLNKEVVKVECIAFFVKKNSCRRRLWHGLEHIEKSIRKVMRSSSKLVRATTKISLPNEGWRSTKHKLNKVLQCDESALDRKGIFHAPDFSLIPLMNQTHVKCLE